MKFFGVLLTVFFLVMVTIVLLYMGAIVLKVAYYMFKRTRLYRWIKKNTSDDIDQCQDKVVILNEKYIYVPDYIGDGPGSFVNMRDWEAYKQDKLSIDMVREFYLNAKGVEL